MIEQVFIIFLSFYRRIQCYRMDGYIQERVVWGVNVRKVSCSVSENYRTFVMYYICI